MNSGPDLSVALAGLEAERLGAGPGARGLIDWARGAGFRAVQLNAMMPGIRPRELGRSARREVAALLRRSGLVCSGLDLWIPPEHLAQAATADRAVSAVVAAIEMAAELAALGGGAGAGGRMCPVCLTLPASPAEGVIAGIGERADRLGVAVADHAWPPREAGGEDRDAGVPGRAGLGIGIDPAAALSAGGDPGAAVARAGARLAAARLTDIATWGGRVPPGSAGGRLDLLAFKVALATGGFAQRGGWSVLDLRGLAEQTAAAAEVRTLWEAIP